MTHCAATTTAVKVVLQVIRQMVADHVIADDAIGGAFGATYFLDPFHTQDIPKGAARVDGSLLAEP